MCRGAPGTDGRDRPHGTGAGNVGRGSGEGSGAGMELAYLDTCFSPVTGKSVDVPSTGGSRALWTLMPNGAVRL